MEEPVLLAQLGPIWQMDLAVPGPYLGQDGAEKIHERLAIEAGTDASGVIRIAGIKLVGHVQRLSRTLL